MSENNPDFRGVDEVDLSPVVTTLPGWRDDENSSESKLIEKERKTLEAIEASQPRAFQTRPARKVAQAMLDKWNRFQKYKGRGEGSADWSLLDEFYTSKETSEGVFTPGQPLLWKPQIIGSCVMSNTFRAWVARLMYQIIIVGDPMEHIGRNEFGPDNFAPYGPYGYGIARRKANMRGGDGLYCAPMAWALMQGSLPCNTPKLLEILRSQNAVDRKDFPEPQSATLYRKFGKWQFLDELEPYADYPVEECPSVKSADQLWQLLQDGKPAFVCSMEAIHKVGTHPDGFPIHARNPRDRWAHNMAFHGCWVASDGERFFRQSNESWGAQHIYNRRFDEVDKSFQSNRLTSQAIGQIAGPSSSPPSLM